MIKRILFSIILILLASLAVLSFSQPQERASPGDWVKETQIQVYPSGIILNIKNASWASFTDTNSMDPFLDAESNALEVRPTSASQVQEETSFPIILLMES